MTLKDAIDLLSKAGIEDAAYDARELFCEIGGIDRSKLVFLDTVCDSETLAEAIERRMNREPLQYIIGHVDFYRERYKVTPDALIPRSDTEILVDHAVRHIPCGESFLDLCTGSGCVAVSVLKNTHSTKAVAIDISPAAAALAEHNAKKNGVKDRLNVIVADVSSFIAEEKYFAILSNPPYVEEEVYKELAPEIFFEPKLAFTADDRGLAFYRIILDRYAEHLKPNGFFAFEIGYDQANRISLLARERGMQCEIIKDLSGCDRVAVIRK